MPSDKGPILGLYVVLLLINRERKSRRNQDNEVNRQLAKKHRWPASVGGMLEATA